MVALRTNQGRDSGREKMRRGGETFLLFWLHKYTLNGATNLLLNDCKTTANKGAESVRIWKCQNHNFFQVWYDSDTFQVQRIMTLSVSDTFRFGILNFWHLPVRRDFNTFRFWYFPVLNFFSYLETLTPSGFWKFWYYPVFGTFRFCHFQILTHSDSDTFRIGTKIDSDTFRFWLFHVSLANCYHFPIVLIKTPKFTPLYGCMLNKKWL